MIALDTNILVYARRSETAQHRRAKEILQGLAEGDRSWALPWPCVYEFCRVVTHPRVFSPASELEAVIEDLDSLLDSPSLTLLGDGRRHKAAMREAIVTSRATGNLIHDAHIAALLLEHGVREFWTGDRDFARFRGFAVRYPLD